jgi:uroporphyrinogen-III synthase
MEDRKLPRAFAMQENNIHILSTRLLRSSSLSTARKAGLVIEERSFVETVPLAPNRLREMMDGIVAESSSVVFTSTAAVRAVVAAEINNDDWQIYCTAPSTSEIVASSFGEKKIKGKAQNAQQLAQLIIADGPPAVLFFCGSAHREDLPSMLGQNGIQVIELIVYESRLLPQEIRQKFNGILFFSPSAVISFFSNNPCAAQTVLFAIGNTTADEIRRHTNNELIVSGNPSEENMIQLAIERFKQQ